MPTFDTPELELNQNNSGAFTHLSIDCIKKANKALIALEHFKGLLKCFDLMDFEQLFSDEGDLLFEDIKTMYDELFFLIKDIETYRFTLKQLKNKD